MIDNHCKTLKRQFNTMEEIDQFAKDENINKYGDEYQAYECPYCGKLHIEIVKEKDE